MYLQPGTLVNITMTVVEAGQRTVYEGDRLFVQSYVPETSSSNGKAYYVLDDGTGRQEVSVDEEHIVPEKL